MCGCYMDNPKNESKLEFLQRVGQEITFEELLKFEFNKHNVEYPVAFFMNMHVDIGAILYNPKELLRFCRDIGDNGRYFLVKYMDLILVSDITNYI